MDASRLLIIGSSGVLGYEFKRLLGDSSGLYPSKLELDITCIDSIRKYMHNKNISFVINCAANRYAEEIESNPSLARLINTVGAQNLAFVSSQFKIPLIHFSTDYVFDGTKNSPYTEIDITNPLSVYGKTKNDGDLSILQIAETALIFRISWLFSNYKDNFFNRITDLAKKNETIKIVADQTGSPTYAADVARSVLAIIPQVKLNTKEIFNLGNYGSATWYDLAYQIVKIQKISCNVVPILTKDFHYKTKRPVYSVLDKSKITGFYNINLRHYLEGLEECL